MNWRKSSYSGANGAECVEVGHAPGIVAVRDTRDRRGPRLAFTLDAWRRFTKALQAARLPGKHRTPPRTGKRGGVLFPGVADIHRFGKGPDGPARA
jgi:hypothetical protein